jgi:hypothetical protein
MIARPPHSGACPVPYNPGVPTDPVSAQLSLGEVERRVHAELGWRVVGSAELGTGTNNRLFRLDLDDGPPLLAKLYARDRWDRLGTEYPALEFLARHGIGGAPRPFLRDDAHLFGVYSFEAGERRAPTVLGAAEAVAAAKLAANLHAFPPSADGELPPASAACFSLADQIRLIEWRLHAFEADAYPEVRAQPVTRDLRATIERLVAAAIDGLTADEVALPIPQSDW